MNKIKIILNIFKQFFFSSVILKEDFTRIVERRIKNYIF